MRQLWNEIVAWVLSIPADKRLHFVCGLIIAVFFAIALDMKFCFWPVIFFAAVKEVFSSGQKFDWKDFAATLLGAVVPQLFVLLNIWWF